MKTKLYAFVATHWQIASVLLGVFLVATSTGVYTNWDARIEFEAASNVVTHGFPLVTTGLMINQPPLGFYMDAPVFHLAGLSYQNGVGIVTAFGLGCAVLVYALGLLLYGKNTGLVAAALFSVVPWHVYLSRIFLIDNQYLFFSLLALIVGVIALRRQSDKLLLVSGVFFAVAFLTKLFAVFILVPLVLMAFFYRRDGKFQLTAKKTLLFLAPTIVTQAIWYGVIANQNFFAVYLSSDFTHPELVADPALAFLPIVLVKSIGWFLLFAAVLALALPLFFRKMFAGRTWLDTVCVVTIVAVAAANLLLVFGFHLKVPYISVVKYNYVALPFYCLLAASLVDKGARLLAGVKLRRGRELATSVVAAVGLFLLVAALVESVIFLVEWEGFVSFGVDSVVYYGFEVYSPVPDYFAELHYLGLAVILASLALPLLFNTLRVHRNVPPRGSQENGD
ncbi:MAG TPA: glycosyltransferase family 39 protein [Candidatus Deferrimicrobiaceae bacterium]|nr:glycosyltransferase family 39 protein [Candidatus Deferrimicrobiaceae bacterium]